MICRCLRNTGATLGLPPRGFYYSERTTFEVTVGKDYRILGLGIYETVLLALVYDDTKKPNWLPAGLFQISKVALPNSWRFSVCDGVAASGGDASGRWVALWGYEELIEDHRHSDALIERDQSALEIFFRRLNG